MKQFETMENSAPFASVAAHGPDSRYRPDIDGLRALAVIAVLFFHLSFNGFAGGFVGVDIFFVISGFLITQLIIRDIEAGSFSLLHFFERRIRRLVPALLAMLAASLAAGALLFLPMDWAKMARNAASAGAFLSNISYWLQIDYFDGDAQARALLHTWSLGVEEQFYLTFPLVLLACARFGRIGLIRVTAGIAVLSFAASVWMTGVDQAGAFYLLPFRGWEFLLGSLFALGGHQPARSRLLRALAGIAGIALIGYSIFTFDDMTVFPGASALIPCIGTLLLLLAGADSPTGKLFSIAPLTFLGRISYSVYLWHWPLIVFVNYQTIGRLSVWDNLGLAVVSILLGYLSWRFIEQPFRKAKPRETARTVFVRSGLATVAVCGIASLIYIAQGIPQRFPQQTVKLASYAASMNPEGDKCRDVTLQLAPDSTCTIGSNADANTFLWGDSHAGALFGALKIIADNGESTVYGATPQCPPLLNAGTSLECLDGNRKRLDYAISHPEIETVILAARWSLYLDGRFTSAGEAENNNGVPTLSGSDGEPIPLFSRAARLRFRDGLSTLVDTLLANGKHVVLVYPVPETGFDIPSTLALISIRGEDPAKFTTARDVYLERQSHALRILNGIGDHPMLTRVYPDSILCPGARCLTYAKGTPLYFDSHHLSIPGARLLRPELERAIKQRPVRPSA